MTNLPELRPLLNLSRRVGTDPLLTQASTGNSSAKLGGILWIKASGKWMADALGDDFLLPLDLAEVKRECLRKHVDPSERYPRASVETALHAALPHSVVLHVHCVNTVVWAVRRDAPAQLERLLAGMGWQWIPYTASGLPLARKIEEACASRAGANVFVLGNHGLVVCGGSTDEVEALLGEVRRRLDVAPRHAHPADYSALSDLAADSHWDLPDDDAVHALGTDPISRAIVAGGLLFPCQAIMYDVGTAELFRPVSLAEARASVGGNRPFLIVEERGVLVSSGIKPVELAMLSCLAQVVQRLNAGAPLNYLTEAEISGIPEQAACRYRELAGARAASPR